MDDAWQAFWQSILWLLIIMVGGSFAARKGLLGFSKMKGFGIFRLVAAIAVIGMLIVYVLYLRHISEI